MAKAGGAREGYDMQIKLLTIGNSGVGKTCLLLRYANNSFSPTFITTIGIDFKIKTITVDSKRIKLQIWDTAGQERFRTITTSYFRGAHGILLVFDLTDKGSFQSIQTWLGEIQKNADSQVNKVLIGNKCDVEESARAVSRAEGEALAQQNGMAYFETSARKGQGVNEAFENIARQVVERLGREPKPVADAAVVIDDTKKKSGGGGCCK